MRNYIRKAGLVVDGGSWLLLLGYALGVPIALAWRMAVFPVSLLAAGALVIVFSVLPALLIGIVPPRIRIAIRPALMLLIVSGVVLRVAWVVWVTPIQISDSQAYVENARQLLHGNGYFQMLGGYKFLAYRAPGESFLLAGAFALVGDYVWTPAAINIVLYIVACVLLYAVASSVSSRKRALAAVALFAVWPSGIMLTGSALTESVSLTLWLALAFCMVRSTLTGRIYPWALWGGVALGTGILVRPSKLLAGALLAMPAPLDVRPGRTLLRAAIVVLVSALVVAPWTYRNYTKLHAFVLVSTNGGDVFYRANNPLADGGYTAAAEHSFALSDEVAWNNASMRAGENWVLENPLAFLKLAARKILISLSADDTGAYWSLEREHGIRGAPYLVAVLASDIWWFIVWAFIATSLVTNRHLFIERAEGLILTSFSAYFLVIHSIYESQPRYHMPAVGVLLVVAMLWLKPPPGGLFGWCLRNVHPE